MKGRANILNQIICMGSYMYEQCSRKKKEATTMVVTSRRNKSRGQCRIGVATSLQLRSADYQSTYDRSTFQPNRLPSKTPSNPKYASSRQR